MCGTTIGHLPYQIESHFNCSSHIKREKSVEQVSMDHEALILLNNGVNLEDRTKVKKKKRLSNQVHQIDASQSSENKAFNAMVCRAILPTTGSFESVKGTLRSVLEMHHPFLVSGSHLHEYTSQNLRLTFWRIKNLMRGQQVSLIIDGTPFHGAEYISAVARFYCQDTKTVRQLLVAWNKLRCPCNNLVLQYFVRKIQREFDISDQNLTSLSLDRAGYNLSGYGKLKLTNHLLIGNFCWSHLLDLAIGRILDFAPIFKNFVTAWTMISSKSIVFKSQFHAQFSESIIRNVATRWWSIIMVADQLVRNREMLGRFIRSISQVV